MKSHISLFALFCLFGFVDVAAQSLNWQWSRVFAGEGLDYAAPPTIDRHKNMYATGTFRGSNISIGTSTLSNSIPGTACMYLAKYDSTGSLLWAFATEGCGATEAVVDTDGYLYVTGASEISDFSFGTWSFTNTGWELKTFLVKYTPDGNVVWAKIATSQAENYSLGIALDTVGNIIITGGVGESWVSFGNFTLPQHGLQTMYVVRYNPNGTPVSGRSFGTQQQSNSTMCTEPVIDGQTILIAGSFDGGTLTFDSFTLTSLGSWGAGFVVRLDFNFNPILAFKIADNANPMDICIDANHNIYVGGEFLDVADFGDTTIVCAGYADAFVAKYSADGTFSWVRSAGGNDLDRTFSLVYENAGVIALGGFRSPTIVFTDTLHNSSPGTFDCFLVKYDSDGAIQYQSSFGGNADELSGGLSLDEYGEPIVTCMFTSSSIQLGGSTYYNAGGQDAVMAKFYGVVDTTGTIEINHAIRVFPVPASSKIFIPDLTESDCRITITDAVGRIVYHDVVNATRNAVDLSSYSPGVYFLTMLDKSGRLTKGYAVKQ